MTQDSNQPLYFDCHMCGDCCSSWNIPIEAHKVRQLLGKAWVQDRLQETHRELVALSEHIYRIPLTDENVCVFLAEDKRCLIQAHEGQALKPHECQRFPFATVKMPDGALRHETSAACKHISEVLLLAFQPILPRPATENNDLTENSQPQEQAQFDVVAELPSRLAISAWPFSPRNTITLAQYQEYQNQLRALFFQSDEPPERLLKAAYWGLRQLRKGQSALPANQWLSAVQFTSKGQVISGRNWAIIAFFLRKPYRTWSVWSLLLGRNYHDPRLFGLPVHLQEIRTNFNASHWETGTQQRLNAFLFNLLQRKRLLCSGASLGALLAMTVVACLLVRWYAQALTWLQAQPRVTEADVSSAIRLVERYYTGHQPRFLQFFASQWKMSLMSRLLLG